LWYLPIALNPIKIGVALTKFCNSKWRGHRLSLSNWCPDESYTDISLHCVHVNCHSIGRNQKPQTRTLDGQYAVTQINQVIKLKSKIKYSRELKCLLDKNQIPKWPICCKHTRHLIWQRKTINNSNNNSNTYLPKFRDWYRQDLGTICANKYPYD
jgi:hypothetical protein